MLGDRYFEHRGFNICERCATGYALMVFEEEARRKFAGPVELINTHKEEAPYK